jgi:hypothetical protein
VRREQIIEDVVASTDRSSGELVGGRYEIVRSLGRGSMGEVLLARQLSLDRLVVVKRVVDAQSAPALVEEAWVAARLHHPNIVTILDVLELDGEPIVVMELVVGVSLRELMEQAPDGVPVEVALAIAIDLLRGLAYAHAVRSGDHVGVVHRDVEPRNVMVTFAGVTKLIDFGISRSLGDRTAPAAISEARGYMPPEQRRGQLVDARADQYAAGVTLREMLTGTEVGEDTAARRALVPCELTAIVERACAEHAEARYAGCGEMLAAIEGYVAARGIAATAMQVERWMTPRFAARRAELERHTEAPRRRARPTTPQPGVAPGLGAELPMLGPDPEEAAAMLRIGAASFELFRRYRAILHQFYSTSFADSRALAASARELVALDPGWAHSYALLALLEGRLTPEALHTGQTALARADAARDPAGMKLVDAFVRIARGELDAAYDLLVDVAAADDTDLLAAANAVVIAVVLHRTDEATAMTRRLHHDYPDLVFGVDLADVFRRGGRDAEAEAVIRAWVAAAPENVPARVELVRLDAGAGRMREAVEQAHATLVIHSERGDVLPELFETMIASEQFAIAQRIADRMLVGSALTRARGRYRLAIAAVFGGRFAAAYDSVRRAIDEHRAFGHESELVQCLELARSVAPLVGDADAQRRFTAELAEVFATWIGDAGTAAATRYELALLERRNTPPSIDDHLEGLADGPVRDVARRRMLRAAAVADCGSPHKAVAAGFSAFEENTASLVALGLCALRLRELELARRSLERATQIWSSMLGTQNSPYHAVLARFHLAGVVAELGDLAGARGWYEAFLRCWGDADRPIPEVASARKLLEHL